MAIHFWYSKQFYWFINYMCEMNINILNAIHRMWNLLVVFQLLFNYCSFLLIFCSMDEGVCWICSVLHVLIFCFNNSYQFIFYLIDYKLHSVLVVLKGHWASCFVWYHASCDEGICSIAMSYWELFLRTCLSTKHAVNVWKTVFFVKLIFLLC